MLVERFLAALRRAVSSVETVLVWTRIFLQLTIPTRGFKQSPYKWNNAHFLQHYAKKLSGEVINKTSPDLLVVRPGEFLTEDVKDALRRRDRIVLFKNFLDPSRDKALLDIGQNPLGHLGDMPYYFETHGDIAALSLHEGIRRMSAGEPFHLGFDSCLANANPSFKNGLLAALSRLTAILPPSFQDPKAFFAHSFLYHGDDHQSELHMAPLMDFSFQISGAKLWRFMRSDFTPLLDPTALRGVPTTSIVGIPRDLVRNPFLPTAPLADLGMVTDVLVEPGDCLFFPENWWHEVHNVGKGWGLMCGLRLKISLRSLARDVFVPKILGGAGRPLGERVAKAAYLVRHFTTRLDTSRPEFRLCTY